MHGLSNRKCHRARIFSTIVLSLSLSSVFYARHLSVPRISVWNIRTNDFTNFERKHACASLSCSIGRNFERKVFLPTITINRRGKDAYSTRVAPKRLTKLQRLMNLFLLCLISKTLPIATNRRQIGDYLHLTLLPVILFVLPFFTLRLFLNLLLSSRPKSPYILSSVCANPRSMRRSRSPQQPFERRDPWRLVERIARAPIDRLRFHSEHCHHSRECRDLYNRPLDRESHTASNPEENPPITWRGQPKLEEPPLFVHYSNDSILQLETAWSIISFSVNAGNKYVYKSMPAAPTRRRRFFNHRFLSSLYPTSNLRLLRIYARCQLETRSRRIIVVHVPRSNATSRGPIVTRWSIVFCEIHALSCRSSRIDRMRAI